MPVVIDVRHTPCLCLCLNQLLLFVVDVAGTEGRNPVDDLRNLRREIELYVEGGSVLLVLVLVVFACLSVCLSVSLFVSLSVCSFVCSFIRFASSTFACQCIRVPLPRPGTPPSCCGVRTLSWPTK